MKSSTIFFVCIIGLALCGCGTTYSLKEFAPVDDAPKSAFVDIKQRAILSAKRSDNTVVMCAEPSPDAMSSFASELALDAKYKEAVAATLALSQQEAASFVGLRTQTIQLLRDGMYRLCEGYMSGALTSADYAWLSRRYQRNMVALLTIEQLTRVAQVPAIAHTSQGLASASRSATAIQSDLAELNKKKSELEKDEAKLSADLKAVQALPDSDTEKKRKVEAATKLVDEKKVELGGIDELKTALLDGLKAAKGLLSSGGNSVQIVTAGVVDAQSTRSNEVVKEIGKLTAMVLAQDDLPTLCFQLITGERVPERSDDALKKLMENCSGLVEARLQSEGPNDRLTPTIFLNNQAPFRPRHWLDGSLPNDDGTAAWFTPPINARR